MSLRVLTRNQSCSQHHDAGRRERWWISPLFYSVGDDYDLYWGSAVDARHSANVRERAEIGVVIIEAKPAAAVYLQAEARELVADGDVLAGIEVMRRRPQPDRWVIEGLVADVTGDGPWRVYRATPKTIEIRAETISKVKGRDDQGPWRLSRGEPRG